MFQKKCIKSKRWKLQTLIHFNEKHDITLKNKNIKVHTVAKKMTSNIK